MLLRNRLSNLQFASLLSPRCSSSSSSSSLKTQPFTLSLRATLSCSASARRSPTHHVSATKATTAATTPSPSDTARFVRNFLFVPPGVEPEEVTEEMVLPGSNIVVGPYAGDAKIKDVEFVKSSGRAKDCPKDGRPEFAILGRSNVGKSSLINALVRKKEVALTSKKPGKTQLINHFLVNKSWYFVDLPGYGLRNTIRGSLCCLDDFGTRKDLPYLVTAYAK
ncbi:hypothetical protein TIFTF001_004600 [Ficus carica]|uniref:EngB-type G domain-containing protein n=1 Tax=Ficus carica TaxID=3494 RepID=A0AA87ZDI8_FICCA|nr:hypothetical protein TIFTF001_004600 [Ficus carica]